MKMDGYEVLTSTDGEDGLKKIKEESPDLILLDIILPKRNGFEVLERLKKIGNKIPVIIISNSGQPVEIDRAIALGIKDYLVKTDFTPADVLVKVEALLGPSPMSITGKIAIGNDTEEGEKTAAPEIKKEKIEENGRFNRGSAKNKVMIVEDDKFLRELIGQKLIREGMEISGAITAEEALTLLKKEKPHLILLDIILPGMSGFEFLKKIKEDLKFSDIPVVVLSNLGEEKDKKTAMDLGAKSFLIKAMHAPNEIVEEIKRVLSESYL